VSWKTLVSVTAYHSFAGKVEVSNTPTIRRLTPSRRHQLSPIAPGTSSERSTVFSGFCAPALRGSRLPTQSATGTVRSGRTRSTCKDRSSGASISRFAIAVSGFGFAVGTAHEAPAKSDRAPFARNAKAGLEEHPGTWSQSWQLQRSGTRLRARDPRSSCDNAIAKRVLGPLLWPQKSSKGHKASLER
jgi:hypothetical protein